jgi:hypothetical protein
VEEVAVVVSSHKKGKTLEDVIVMIVFDDIAPKEYWYGGTIPCIRRLENLHQRTLLPKRIVL